VFLSVLYVILLIFFVKSLLKQQSTQLPAIKAVISHEILKLRVLAPRHGNKKIFEANKRKILLWQRSSIHEF
jgi:hypothetical protein